MKICVICQSYPSERAPEVMAFTHARNVMYVRAGHAVTVLDFSAAAPYVWDSIPVQTERDISRPEQVAQFDIMVFHSPNLRNHLRFMLRHRKHIKAKVLVAHGFEFLPWLNLVGRQFSFRLNWKFKLRMRLIGIYDWLKMRVWAWYIKSRRTGPLNLIFVSDWLRQQVEVSFGFDLNRYAEVREINNPVYPAFLEQKYQAEGPKDADFVTIRSFDEPKYAVDVVLEFAKRHPQWTFDVFGYGEFFKHYLPPSNLRVHYRRFRQSELPALLNRYRAAFLPTRWDSQGVLMCEMACLGMPLVVSDLPICRTMVGDFDNVVFINNDRPELRELPRQRLTHEGVKDRFAVARTVGQELELFGGMVDARTARKGPLQKDSGLMDPASMVAAPKGPTAKVTGSDRPSPAEISGTASP